MSVSIFFIFLYKIDVSMTYMGQDMGKIPMNPNQAPRLTNYIEHNAEH